MPRGVAASSLRDTRLDIIHTEQEESTTPQYLSTHTRTRTSTSALLYFPTKSFSAGNWDKLFWQGKTSVLREQI